MPKSSDAPISLTDMTHHDLVAHRKQVDQEIAKRAEVSGRRFIWDGFIEFIKDDKVLNILASSHSARNCNDQQVTNGNDSYRDGRPLHALPSPGNPVEAGDR